MCTTQQTQSHRWCMRTNNFFGEQFFRDVLFLLLSQLWIVFNIWKYSKACREKELWKSLEKFCFGAYQIPCFLIYYFYSGYFVIYPCVNSVYCTVNSESSEGGISCKQWRQVSSLCVGATSSSGGIFWQQLLSFWEWVLILLKSILPNKLTWLTGSRAPGKLF